MLKKIFITLVLSLAGIAVSAQNPEEYDQRMLQYINREAWFEAKALYDDHGNDLTEVVRLISASFLDTYFNQPADGVAHTGELLQKYGEQLGGQCVLYRMLMAKNLAFLRDYARMDSVLTHMLVHDSPYLDDGSRQALKASREQCRMMARLPQPEMIDRSDTANGATVPLETDDNLFYLDVGFCGKSMKTLLDTGAEYTAMDQSLADELGVRILRDSLQTSRSSHVKMGLVDSLQIGSITLKNEICYVFPDGFGAHPDSDIAKIRALLGISTLKRLRNAAIDTEHKTITFCSGERPNRNAVNFMLKDNVPYIRLTLNGIPATMYWDTGMSACPQLSGKFYANHASSFPELSPVRKGLHATVGGVTEYDYYEIKDITVQTPSSPLIIPELRVVFDVDRLNPAGITTYDGQMGNLPGARRIRIDFENMCVSVE